MTLTHIQITHAKPAVRAYKLADSGALYLVVNPNGTKLWRMNYRFLSRQKTLHFGEWPIVSLADARTRRDEARRQLAAGLDPVEERKADRLAKRIAADNTFKGLTEARSRPQALPVKILLHYGRQPQQVPVCPSPSAGHDIAFPLRTITILPQLSDEGCDAFSVHSDRLECCVRPILYGGHSISFAADSRVPRCPGKTH